MVNLRHILAALAVTCFFVQPVFAQEEVLVGLQAQPREWRHRAKANSLLRSTSLPAEPVDTLSLPFFDDFSAQTQGVPNPRKWLNRYVFVNNSYAINPPTTGVATFDILDETGHVYSNASPQPFAADTLTSIPINLQPSDANVYFSFAYQPKGNGDMPERRDSLTLQFYSPADSAWVPMWGAITDTIGGVLTPNLLKEYYHWQRLGLFPNKIIQSTQLASSFYKVVVPVSAARFLHPGFQFRFVNYATRLKDEVAGKEGNCDMWNVDVVYLNRNRSATDTVMIDVAIQTPMLRVLKDYTAMPWRHLKGSTTAQREQLVNAQGTGVTISPKIANLYNQTNAFQATFELSCIKGSVNPFVKRYQPFTTDIARSTTRAFDYNLPSNDFLNTPQPDADSVAFDIKLTINNYLADQRLAAEYRSNDTCVLRQYFYPYYAYDDGTAENGYGVFGDQADRAKVAVRYKCYQRDTLSGVYMYFNNTLDSGNVQPFRLTVWSDRSGVPGDELYTEANLYPRFDSLNSYVYYELTRPVVVAEGAIFYVGWAQQSTAMLNVGFDVNSPVVGKNYVSNNGFSWAVSKFDGQGAIMIRPSFAKRQFNPTAVEKGDNAAYSIIVYPNPTQGELRFGLPNDLYDNLLQVEIFDLLGRRVMVGDVMTGTSLNVERLVQGKYFMRFVLGGRVVGYSQFVKM